LGFAIVVCSWWLHMKSADYRPLMGNQWFTAPVVLIISGFDLIFFFLILNSLFFFQAKVSMLLGAVGCVGAWFEKKYLLFAVNINQFLIFHSIVFLSIL